MINNDQKQFQNACKNGNLNKAKTLVTNNSNIDISFGYEMAFREACEYGHLNVAKWLLNIKPNINTIAWQYYAFDMACLNGHLHVAKWLLEVKPKQTVDDIYLSANNESAFRNACFNRHLNVAQWFCKLNPFKYCITIAHNGVINNNNEYNIMLLLFGLNNKGYCIIVV